MTDPAARRLHAAALAITVAAAVVNAVLAAAGIVSPTTAFTLWLAVELPLAAILTTITVVRVRAARRRGRTWSEVLDDVAGPTPAELIRFELRGYRSLWLWLRRRYDGVSSGVEPIGYTKGTMAVPVAFLVAAVAETVVVHVLVPWPPVRTVLLLLSLWGLVQIAGVLTGRITHPHLLAADRLIVRSGHQVIVELERAAVRRCVARRRWEHTDVTVDGEALYLPGPDGTCVDLVLTEPVEVRVPRFLAHRRPTATVSRLSLQVDDPDAVAASLTPRSTDGASRIRAGE
ncbi:MAG: hypothetical protein GXY65_17050 [Rhodococcus sp.]|uniref:hypothetical protein n=1 Tax=Rhodococcus TaxID=1827 RepID=UPI0016A6C72A|nr:MULTISPECIES: hypothetical protein [Rhodococcus]NLV81012.1 hypothetical protein [Rhodococcus sp. (in: high G+C Gram-positive bacteria)]